MAGSDEPFGVQPARWIIGPPAPRLTAFLARACSLGIIIIVGHWVHASLGGVALRPTEAPNGGNDTGKLFNWHPVLMTLGFAVLMAEALLSYQAPLIPGVPRSTRKQVHAGCHAAALICLAGGLAAVVSSHRLKLPAPIPDWYSPHSYMGLTALVLVGAQFLFGLYAYVAPRLPLPQRMALGPLHRTAGCAAWVAGLAALGSGLQEKVTFLQLGRGMAGPELYSATVRLPAAVMPLLVVLAVLVLYHQVPPAGTTGPAGGAVLGLSADASGSGSGGSVRQSLLRGALEDEEEKVRGRQHAV